jgi:hypothetical protein
LIAYALGAFVLGVVTSVVLLLGSLTTGLTLPGKPRPDRGRSSLLYFFSIVRDDEATWRRRWRDDVAAESLRRDLLNDYIDEAYNLARRTNHKYWRTNEAAAVLTFTLFCLGTAVILVVAVAASHPASGTAVVVGTPLRWTLGVYAGAYTCVVVLMSRRDEWLQRSWLAPDVATRRARELGVVQVVAPLLVVALAVSDTRLSRHVSLVLVAVAFCAVLGWLTRDDGGSKTWGLPVLVLVAAAGGVLATGDDDTWRLLAAAAVPFLLAAREVWDIAQRTQSARRPG